MVTRFSPQRSRKPSSAAPTIQERSACAVKGTDLQRSARSPSTSRSATTSPTATSFPTTWEATMPSDDIAVQLRSIGFRASAVVLRSFIEHATHGRLGPVEICEKLVEIERREREVKNLAARMRMATLGKFTSIDRFDWNHPKTINRDLYENLHATLDFVERGENVLFRGPSGVGKTTLAQNL